MDKEKNKLRQARYRKTHREQINARRNSTRLEIIETLGGKCVKCGFTDVRALQIDHINGGGRKEYIEKGNSHSWKHYQVIKQKLLNGSQDYQILCANCNWIKRYENKEFGNHLFNYRDEKGVIDSAEYTA